jgi:hypothetical protein
MAEKVFGAPLTILSRCPMAACSEPFATPESSSLGCRRRNTSSRNGDWRRNVDTGAEDDAPILLAEIAMRRALNVGGEPPKPRRKRAKKYRIVK